MDRINQSEHRMSRSHLRAKLGMAVGSVLMATTALMAHDSHPQEEPHAHYVPAATAEATPTPKATTTPIQKTESIQISATQETKTTSVAQSEIQPTAEQLKAEKYKNITNDVLSKVYGDRAANQSVWVVFLRGQNPNYPKLDGFWNPERDYIVVYPDVIADKLPASQVDKGISYVLAYESFQRDQLLNKGYDLYMPNGKDIDPRKFDDFKGRPNSVVQQGVYSLGFERPANFPGLSAAESKQASERNDIDPHPDGRIPMDRRLYVFNPNEQRPAKT